jgi:riboflavin kinase/FMN adenylyltransferase
MTQSRDGSGATIAVGVFDGLHLGHIQILERAVQRARRRRARSVVVSFDPHPDLVLAKSFHPVAPLTPHAERRARLGSLGVDAYEVIPFTRELASLEPVEFVLRYLVEPLGMVDLVVGENFALGRGRSGNVDRLRGIGAERGFDVEAVPLLEIGGAPVTSTRIRQLLDRGRVQEAETLLGRPYGLAGRVVPGNRIGRTLGVPTANLQLHEEKFVPSNGIYAVWARIEGEPTWRPAAMSIGVRPTVGGQVRTLEVHLLDWSGELQGRELEVEFAHWLRPEIRFESLEALRVAMLEDLARVRAMLPASARV